MVRPRRRRPHLLGSRLQPGAEFHLGNVQGRNRQMGREPQQLPRLSDFIGWYFSSTGKRTGLGQYDYRPTISPTTKAPAAISRARGNPSAGWSTPPSRVASQAAQYEPDQPLRGAQAAEVPRPVLAARRRPLRRPPRARPRAEQPHLFRGTSRFWTQVSASIRTISRHLHRQIPPIPDTRIPHLQTCERLQSSIPHGGQSRCSTARGGCRRA